jgi:predicted ester cyclase
MTNVKDTTDRFIAAFNAHDEKALLALHSAHIKFDAPGFKASNSTEATAFATRWLKAFPNGKMIVRSEIVSAPWVIQEITMEGVHTARLEGPMGTIPPTHKKVSGHGVQLLRVENDQIVEARVYYDQYEFMSQLGLIPAPAIV